MKSAATDASIPYLRVSEPAPAVNLILQAALEYVRLGFYLLPLQPRSKEPYFALLPRVKGEAKWKPLSEHPADEAEVRRWFEYDPECNIGILCSTPFTVGGTRGYLVAADFDRPAPWGRYPLGTAPRFSGKRGPNVLYLSEKPLRCCAFTYGDIKGKGGYVVVPPSIHPDGPIYQWKEFFSLSEVELEPAPEWLLNAVKRARRVQVIEKQQARRRVQPVIVPNASAPLRRLTSDDLRRWASNEKAALEMVRVMGIEISKIGEGFRCILPGHKDNHPSASLYQLENGAIAYRDWHRKSEQVWLPLATVRAALAYGEVKQLNKGELAVWQTRLLIEADLIAPALVTLLPLPAGESETVREVYKGFRYLLACKWLREPNSPTAFTYRFAAAWCGVGVNQAGEAIKRLLALRIIKARRAPRRAGVKVVYTASRPRIQE